MKQLLLLCIAISNLCYAQTTQKSSSINNTTKRDYQYITIKTVDKIDKSPLPFINIDNIKRQIYRITNDNGELNFPYKEAHLNDTINISGIGIQSKKIAIKDLKKTIALTTTYTNLEEVIVTAKLSPTLVIKETIKRLKENHPTKAHNYHRYTKILKNQNDANAFELELIAKEYNFGYDSEFVATHKLEKTKWNYKGNKLPFKYSSSFLYGRENPIQYANVFHKRKYKKFNFKFVKTTAEENEIYYIISFETDKNQWRFTNKSYPTRYFGTVYIRKEDFSVAKVVQKWEANLNKTEIDNYFKISTMNNAKIYRSKEEETAVYQKQIDNKYYASSFSEKMYSEIENYDTSFTNINYLSSTKLYNHQLKNVEKIAYEYHDDERKYTVFSTIKETPKFWREFNSKTLK